mmetsp:Transcript_49915/g.144808  ORF Transcript_49915/g.144808 Transcript_49915/m.144808 type:complete len:274 (+) Transcript_49915:4728-5549(+)
MLLPKRPKRETAKSRTTAVRLFGQPRTATAKRMTTTRLTRTPRGPPPPARSRRPAAASSRRRSRRRRTPSTASACCSSPRPAWACGCRWRAGGSVFAGEVAGGSSASSCWRAGSRTPLRPSASSAGGPRSTSGAAWPGRSTPTRRRPFCPLRRRPRSRRPRSRRPPSRRRPPRSRRRTRPRRAKRRRHRRCLSRWPRSRQRATASWRCQRPSGRSSRGEQRRRNSRLPRPWRSGRSRAARRCSSAVSEDSWCEWELSPSRSSAGPARARSCAD